MTTLATTFDKYVSERIDKGFDWSSHLSNQGTDGAADTIATSVWAADSGITLSGDALDDTETKTAITITGGTAGTTYTIENTITMTDSAQIRVRAFRVRVSLDPV
jgi:hypothetical protein